MNAAEYSEWCDCAGLYLGNHSHSDRYRTFQQKISPAGLTTRIIRDFLRDNEGGIDVNRWRSSNVYEIGEYARFRIEQTAAALETVGAPRLAAAVRVAKDTSISGMLFQPGVNPGELMERLRGIGPAKMMEEFRANVARMFPEMAAQTGLPVPERKPVPPAAEHESWEQLEHLLGKYVERQKSDLQADVEKYGDPRTQTGYDPKQRERELEQMRQREWDLDRQREEAPKLTRLLEKIEARAAKDPKVLPRKLADQRREVLRAWKQYSARDAADLTPEMRRWLGEARRVMGLLPSIFDPRPTEDETLLRRLAGWGEYAVDFDRVDRKAISIRWEEPAGLTCDWTSFALILRVPAGNPELLGEGLEACDRLRERFAEHSALLRGEVLDHFEVYREHVGGWLFEPEELGADGRPTEASILRRTGGGGIHVSADRDGVHAEVFFHVDWDDEHGLEIPIEDL